MTRIPDRYFGVFVGVVTGIPLLVSYLLLFYALSGDGSGLLLIAAYAGSVIALGVSALVWMHYIWTTGRPGGFR